MKKNFQSFGLGVLCLFCLTAFHYPAEIERVPAIGPASFTFADERPPQQLKSGFESLMITNCAYGSIRIGARDITPDPSILLQDMLTNRLNPALAGRSVTLKNFTLHANNAAPLRKSVGSMYSGLIPDLMNNKKKVGCAPDDLRGGYVLGEVPLDTAPLVAVVDVAVGDQTFHARCLEPRPMAPPAKKMTKAELQVEWNRLVGTVVTCALGRLDQQMTRAFSPGAAATAAPASAASAAQPAPASGTTPPAEAASTSPPPVPNAAAPIESAPATPPQAPNAGPELPSSGG